MDAAVLCGLGGFVFGALLAACAGMVWVDRLRRACAKAEMELGYERAARAEERAQSERLQEERARTLNASLQRLLAEVTQVTNAALKSREEELSAKNRQLLQPLSEQIARLQKDSAASQAQMTTRLDSFFSSLTETAAKFGQEARTFRDAMRGANKQQGTWGENILKALLESFGLQEGVHYLLQTGVQGKIPDALVIDHVGRRILVVDSKMSWTNYAASFEMEEGPQREAELKKHVQSVRKHIEELAQKDYPSLAAPAGFESYKYVPLTAMFVPCEAALEAAVRVDAKLMDFAFKNKVVLVTPPTLLGFLLLVSQAWSQFQVERNTQEIIKQARLLVERVDALFAALEDTQTHLEKGRQGLDKALKLAAKSGEGRSIVYTVNRIIKLGAPPVKKLKSQALLADPGANAADATDNGTEEK